MVFNPIIPIFFNGEKSVKSSFGFLLSLLNVFSLLAAVALYTLKFIHQIPSVIQSGTHISNNDIINSSNSLSVLIKVDQSNATSSDFSTSQIDSKECSSEDMALLKDSQSIGIGLNLSYVCFIKVLNTALIFSSEINGLYLRFQSNTEVFLVYNYFNTTTLTYEKIVESFIIDKNHSLIYESNFELVHATAETSPFLNYQTSYLSLRSMFRTADIRKIDDDQTFQLNMKIHVIQSNEAIISNFKVQEIIIELLGYPLLLYVFSIFLSSIISDYYVMSNILSRCTVQEKEFLKYTVKMNELTLSFYLRCLINIASSQEIEYLRYFNRFMMKKVSIESKLLETYGFLSETSFKDRSHIFLERFDIFAEKKFVQLSSNSVHRSYISWFCTILFLSVSSPIAYFFVKEYLYQNRAKYEVWEEPISNIEISSAFLGGLQTDIKFTFKIQAIGLNISHFSVIGRSKNEYHLINDVRSCNYEDDLLFNSTSKNDSLCFSVFPFFESEKLDMTSDISWELIECLKLHEVLLNVDFLSASPIYNCTNSNNSLQSNDPYFEISEVIYQSAFIDQAILGKIIQTTQTFNPKKIIPLNNLPSQNSLFSQYRLTILTETFEDLVYPRINKGFSFELESESFENTNYLNIGFYSQHQMIIKVRRTDVINQSAIHSLCLIIVIIGLQYLIIDYIHDSIAYYHLKIKTYDHVPNSQLTTKSDLNNSSDPIVWKSSNYPTIKPNWNFLSYVISKVCCSNLCLEKYSNLESKFKSELSLFDNTTNSSSPTFCSKIISKFDFISSNCSVMSIKGKLRLTTILGGVLSILYISFAALFLGNSVYKYYQKANLMRNIEYSSLADYPSFNDDNALIAAFEIDKLFFNSYQDLSLSENLKIDSCNSTLEFLPYSSFYPSLNVNNNLYLCINLVNLLDQFYSSLKLGAGINFNATDYFSLNLTKTNIEVSAGTLAIVFNSKFFNFTAGMLVNDLIRIDLSKGLNSFYLELIPTVMKVDLNPFYYSESIFRFYSVDVRKIMEFDINPQEVRFYVVPPKFIQIRSISRRKLDILLCELLSILYLLFLLIKSGVYSFYQEYLLIRYLAYSLKPIILKFNSSKPEPRVITEENFELKMVNQFTFSRFLFKCLFPCCFKGECFIKEISNFVREVITLENILKAKDEIKGKVIINSYLRFGSNL